MMMNCWLSGVAIGVDPATYNAQRDEWPPDVRTTGIWSSEKSCSRGWIKTSCLLKLDQRNLIEGEVD